MSRIDVIDLELTVIKADGLAAKDTNFFGMATKSDPYVIVNLCPRGVEDGENYKILLGKTVPKMKTLSPRWDQSFQYSLPRHEFNQLAMLELTIMDYDDGDDDDLMGVVLIRIPISRPGIETKWYGVPATSAGGEEATGRIQCTLGFRSGSKTPEELELQNANLSLTSAVATKPERASKSSNQEEFVDLKFVVKKAKDLTPMDRNLFGVKSSSDPYIEVRLCPHGPGGDDKKIFLGKTETKFQTLNPEYNMTFEKSLPLRQFDRNKAMIELTILDADDNKDDDDLMGVIQVPIPIGSPCNTIQWYDIPPDSGQGGRVTGRVMCALTYNRTFDQVQKGPDTTHRLTNALAGATKNVLSKTKVVKGVAALSKTKVALSTKTKAVAGAAAGVVTKPLMRGGSNVSEVSSGSNSNDSAKPPPDADPNKHDDDNDNDNNDNDEEEKESADILAAAQRRSNAASLRRVAAANRAIRKIKTDTEGEDGAPTTTPRKSVGGERRRRSEDGAKRVSSSTSSSRRHRDESNDVRRPSSSRGTRPSRRKSGDGVDEDGGEIRKTSSRGSRPSRISPTRNKSTEGDGEPRPLRRTKSSGGEDGPNGISSRQRRSTTAEGKTSSSRRTSRPSGGGEDGESKKSASSSSGRPRSGVKSSGEGRRQSRHPDGEGGGGGGERRKRSSSGKRSLKVEEENGRSEAKPKSKTGASSLRLSPSRSRHPE